MVVVVVENKPIMDANALQILPSWAATPTTCVCCGTGIPQSGLAAMLVLTARRAPSLRYSWSWVVAAFPIPSWGVRIWSAPFVGSIVR
eukprot:4180627-Pyramimonas_sp.AAC.1